MPHRLSLVLVAVVCCLLGCDGTAGPSDGDVVDTGSVDGGVDADAAPPLPFVPATPASVAVAAPPDFGPCPSGWRESESFGVAVCEPWPASGRDDACPAGQAHLPGEPGCVVLGPACPSGEWPASAPAGAIYVRAGAGSGGSGTQADPYFRISDALAAAGAGGVIVLSKGTFVEDVVLTGDLTLRGTCAAETILSGETPRTLQGAIRVTDGSPTIESLTILGPGRPGIVVVGTAAVTVSGVVLSESSVAGVWLSDASSITASELAIDGVAQDSMGNWGYAIALQGSATGTFDHLAVHAARDQGIRAEAGTTLAIDDAVISETEPRGDALGGRGINVLGQLRLARVVVEDNLDQGVIAFGDAASAEMTDVVIRRTAARESDGRFGRGVSGEEGAVVRCTRCRIEDSGDLGVQAWDGSSITLEDALVAVTAPRPDELVSIGAMAERGSSLTCTRAVFTRHVSTAVGALEGGMVVLTDVTIRDQDRVEGMAGGRGIEMGVTTTLRAERLVIEDVHEVGLFADGAEEISLTDVTIRNIGLGTLEPSVGAGMMITGGAALSIARGYFDGNHYAGLIIDGPETTATLTDLEVRATDPGSYMDVPFSRGLSVQSGAVATLERAIIEGNSEVGVGVVAGSLTASDVVIRDSRERPDGLFGQGLGVTTGGILIGERLSISGNQEAGLVADGEGTRVTLTDLIVDGTESRSFDARLGVGIGSQNAAVIEGEGLFIEGNRHVGMIASGDAELRARDVTVSATRSPLCAVDAACGDFGMGVLAVTDGYVSLTAFLLDANDVIGIALSEGGTADLEDGTVRAHAIGASVETEGFDLSRITTDVRYEDNETNLGSTTLPVPPVVGVAGATNTPM